MSNEQNNKLSQELVEEYEKQLICDGCDELISEKTEILKKDIFWKKYNFCCVWCLTDFENHIRKSYLQSLIKKPSLEKVHPK
jgi:hypothetical protein